ncbi:MAG: penicillin-binding protein 2 [Coriobacteriia bacterium]|nr:penicillin-binding protein 2 [Coriobacteriia bacterium]
MRIDSINESSSFDRSQSYQQRASSQARGTVRRAERADNRKLGSLSNPTRPQSGQAYRRVSQSTAVRRERSYNTTILFTLFCLFAIIIFMRLYYIQVYAAKDLASIAQAQRQSPMPQPIKARRGSILDRNGIVLAATVDTVSVYANTLQMHNPKATAFHVAEILGGDAADWLALFQNAPYGATNVLLVRYADLEVAEQFIEYQTILEKNELHIKRLEAKLDPRSAAVWVAETALSCINFDYEYMRVYPYGPIGAQVVGTINNEGVPICGLEMQYDQILSGREGEIMVELGRDGTPLPNGKRTEVPKIDGEDIIISIDIGLQEFVESELRTYGELGSSETGSVTIVDGATGEIYAAASLPLYDRENVTSEEIELGAMSLRGLIYPYEPGSTMKAVTAAGALEAGVVSVDDVFYVPNRLQISGFTIKDWYDRYDENMDLRYMLANSSNIGITLVSQRLGKQGLFDYFFKAGFYQPAHVDYVGLDGTGEPLYISNMKDPVTGAYLSTADKPDYWTDIHAANLSFGQGLHVTALQMAAFYGSFTNRGVLCEPHFLIDRPQSSSPLDYYTYEIMSPETADIMTDLLESVMTEGTGVLASVPGYRIAGKTGTAEKATEYGYTGDVTQSMVGYFIESDCKLVVMVAMDDSELVGAAVAPKPLFASAMEYIANRYWVVPNDVR